MVGSFDRAAWRASLVDEIGEAEATAFEARLDGWDEFLREWGWRSPLPAVALFDRLWAARDVEMTLICEQCGRQMDRLHVGARLEKNPVVEGMEPEQEWPFFVSRSPPNTPSGVVVNPFPGITRSQNGVPGLDLWWRYTYRCHKRCRPPHGSVSKPAEYVLCMDALTIAFIEALDAGRTTIIAGRDTNGRRRPRVRL